MRVLLAALLFFCLSLTYPNVSLAHFFASDESIRATLHIVPQDKPKAGEETIMHIDIVDQEGKFTPYSCTCSLSITRQGDKPHSVSLEPNQFHNTMAMVSYTFPQMDVYTLTVMGEPKSPDSFQQFKLEFVVRVDQEATRPLEDSIFPTFWLIGALVITIPLAVALGRRRRLFLTISILLSVCLSQGALVHCLLQDHHAEKQHECCMLKPTTTPIRTKVLHATARLTPIEEQGSGVIDSIPQRLPTSRSPPLS